jgi:maleate cis-trans isomerase
MEAIASLKKKLGIPVITSNTATIDAILDRVSRMTVSESENFNNAFQRKFQEPI